MNKTKSPTQFEWPTLGLILFCSLTVPLLIAYTDILSLWVTLPLLSIILALHSSIQHEVLHGHPTRFPLVNEALVFVPLGLFLPYRRFRDTHIQHHFDPNLTDPYDDPETNFQDPEKWAKTGKLLQGLLVVNNSLAGRMIVGPLISFFMFYRADMKLISNGEKTVLLAYILHFIGLIPFVFWIIQYGTMPAWGLFLAAYSAISILKIRTYLEHRAHKDSAARSVIIEDRGPLALLFLNNNFHAVHHQNPKLAWYEIPGNYTDNKAQYLANNDNYRYPNYRTIFRQYFFKNKDQVPHPLWPFEDHR